MADGSVTSLLRRGRNGTLWEGRYTSCLVDSADYVLRCYRYIELNPVRGRLIDDPTAWALGHNAFRGMVEPVTSRFAGVRPAYRHANPPRSTNNST